MTLQTNHFSHSVVIDDAQLRVVVNVANKEVRLFSRYTNKAGNPKLRTEKVMEFEAFLKMLYAMCFEGETK